MAKRSVTEVVTGFAVLAAAAGFLAYAAGNTGRSAASGMRLSAEFNNIGTLAAGADVRMAGVPVGRVVSASIDPKTYQAVLHFTVQPDIKLPVDSSAQIATGGLLGGSSLALSPGGDETLLKDGGVITITQSASNLEELLGKFIFNVGNLADATQKSLQQKQGGEPGPLTDKP